MTTAVWRRKSTPSWVLPTVVNTILTLASLAAIAGGFWALWNFQDTAFIDDNPATWENWDFHGGLVIAVAYAVVSVIWWASNEDGGKLRHTPTFTNFWSGLGKRMCAFPFLVWLATLAVIPAAVLLLMAAVPHRVYTPDAHVRLMSDGQVVGAGESTISTRYSSSSTLVPLFHVFNQEVGVRTNEGTFTVQAKVILTLKDGTALRATLARDKSSVESSPATYYEGRVRTYLQPYVARMVEEIRSGKVIHPTVRLTQLTNDDRANLPAEFDSLGLQEVSVVRGSHYY